MVRKKSWTKNCEDRWKVNLLHSINQTRKHQYILTIQFNTYDLNVHNSFVYFEMRNIECLMYLCVDDNKNNNIQFLYAIFGAREFRQIRQWTTNNPTNTTLKMFFEIFPFVVLFLLLRLLSLCCHWISFHLKIFSYFFVVLNCCWPPIPYFVLFFFVICD